MSDSTLRLADMIQFWQDLPHQKAAVTHLETLLKQHVPAEKLLEVARIWRQPAPVPRSEPQLSPVESSTHHSFEQALTFTLQWEGGWSSHPSDLGGDTMCGVTQRSYDQYRQEKTWACRSVKQITKAEVQEIYYQHYWQPSQAGQMVLPLAIVQFDTAVNFGVAGANRFLQNVLGLEPDGIFGPKTQALFKANNNKSTALSYMAKRVAYRHQRVQKLPSQKVFLAGWLNRDRDLQNLLQNL